MQTFLVGAGNFESIHIAVKVTVFCPFESFRKPCLPVAVRILRGYHPGIQSLLFFFDARAFRTAARGMIDQFRLTVRADGAVPDKTFFLRIIKIADTLPYPEDSFYPEVYGRTNGNSRSGHNRKLQRSFEKPAKDLQQSCIRNNESPYAEQG